MSFQPSDIRKVGETELLITWDGGERQLFSLRKLRFFCPCASCVDEITGKRLLTESRIPPDIRMLDSKIVGRYAIQFRWSDGHTTGIYAFDFLHELAPQASPEPH